MKASEKEKVEYSNGDVFEGQLAEGKRVGWGTYLFKSGDHYEGHWEDNLQSGEGVYHFHGKGYYEGQWRNGLPNGQGIFVAKEGPPRPAPAPGLAHHGSEPIMPTRIHSDSLDKYTGSWQDGKHSGYGTAYYSNGDRYEGNFINSGREGKGKYYFD
jgi:hypothetical protein